MNGRPVAGEAGQHSGDPSLPWPAYYVSLPDAAPRDSADRLLALLDGTWAAVRILCASLLDVPQMEFKLAGAQTVFELTELAGATEERLRQLGTRHPQRVRPPDGRQARILASDARTFRLALIYEALLRPLLDQITSALDATDPVFDGPTHRLLRHGRHALQETCAWHAAATDSIRARLGARAVDSALEEVFAAAAPASMSLTRPRMAARDSRMTTFGDTRNYRSAPDWRDQGSSYDDSVIELARINRDEIDAVETFALALFDLVPDASIEALRHLARLVWDESRHAAVGHTLLAERGCDPYAFSCSTIGIRLRSAMDGWDAWAQITLYGELGIIGPMRELAKAAAERGDERTHAAFTYICADEVMHLRESRRLLDAEHPSGGLAEVAESVRQRAAALMDEFGILPKEKYLSLTAAEIFALIGE